MLAPGMEHLRVPPAVWDSWKDTPEKRAKGCSYMTSTHLWLCLPNHLFKIWYTVYDKFLQPLWYLYPLKMQMHIIISPLARKEIPHWQTQKEETKIQNQVKGTDNIQGWKVFNETEEKSGGQAICIA